MAPKKLKTDCRRDDLLYTIVLYVGIHSILVFHTHSFNLMKLTNRALYRHELTLIDFCWWVTQIVHVWTWKTQVTYLSIIRHTPCIVVGNDRTPPKHFSSSVVPRTCKKQWAHKANATQNQRKHNANATCGQRKWNGNFSMTTAVSSLPLNQ